MENKLITLMAAHTCDLPDFKKGLQEAFAIAFIAKFGQLSDGPIPSDDDLTRAFSMPGAEILHVICEDRMVGGAVVIINNNTTVICCICSSYISANMVEA